MGSMFNRMAKACQMGLMAFALCATTGCSSMADDKVQARFMWGPVEEDLGPTVGSPVPAFNGQSKVDALREELLAPVNRYAPSDKDWRYARGQDKGPTIFGARFTFKLEGGGSEFRLGAVRRGSNRTYGPQLIFDMKDR